MGFGAPLLYFLMYRLYLNLIWVKILRKRFFTIFICVVLILVHLFSSSQTNQTGQAVFSPCLDGENSDTVATSGLRGCVRMDCFPPKKGRSTTQPHWLRDPGHVRGSPSSQRSVCAAQTPLQTLRRMRGKQVCLVFVNTSNLNRGRRIPVSGKKGKESNLFPPSHLPPPPFNSSLLLCPPPPPPPLLLKLNINLVINCGCQHRASVLLQQARALYPSSLIGHFPAVSRACF